ncbi:MAG TPA: radical SAM family heme chaperone HemW [Acidimicrobiia bacterium]|nr:radical SAM family heme chaperone HemW [Acidimicrobiia bacterium]
MRTDRPDEPAVVDAAATKVAAYLHVPFCRRLCPYCDFAVQVGGDIDRYVAAVLAEVDAAEPFDRPLDAVYLGGGTPTSLPTEALHGLLERVAQRFGIAADAEVSLEANPEDVTADAAAAWRAAGFNRISLGVQSLHPPTLVALGRGHDAATARSALQTARDAFPSVNADLIFGTPGDDGWDESVAGVLAAGVDHLSVYALTVERGTALSRAVAAGAPAPDPDVQAEAYLVAESATTAAGLVRYETSNYARPGHGCVYNLVTWAQGEYAAFGNGAHRHRAGERSWNVRRVDRYTERALAGETPVAGSERLDRWGREVERVMLGLRRSAGVRAGVAGASLLAAPEGERLVAAGVLGEAGDRIVVTRPLLGDAVTRALLALDPGEC